MITDVFAAPLVQSVLGAAPLTFIDVGAAVGVEEPWRSAMHPQYTRVFGFEPHPDNFAGIARLPNGRYFQQAIAKSRGVARFFLFGTGSSLLDPSRDAAAELPSLEVETETLQHLRESGTIPTLDIVKTDVEKADYDAMASAGPYLASEVLAVQSEFSFAGGGGERPFRDFDAKLCAAGFVLMSLSLQRGSLGEVGGGNFLYLKSIAHIAASPDRVAARTQALKSFVIASAIRHGNYAYIVARAGAEAGLFTAAEGAALRRMALGRIFVPDAMAPSRWKVRLASLLGMLSAFVAGQYWRALSTPESNRLDNAAMLFRRPSFLFPARRVERLYEAYYADFRRRHPGMASQPTDQR